jgi:hypothetical protein
MRYLGTAALTLILGWGSIAILAVLVWLLPQTPDPLWPVPLVLAAVPLAVYLAQWLVKPGGVLPPAAGNSLASYCRECRWVPTTVRKPSNLSSYGAAMACCF